MCAKRGGGRKGSEELTRTLLALLGALDSEGDTISGDIFISLDTVRSNAEKYGVPYGEELQRVMVHGVLHLCGVNDKGQGERKKMEAAENHALTLFW